MFSLTNPIQTFFSTTKNVLLSPVSFYRSVYWENVKVTDSFLYVAICAAVGGILGQIQTFLRTSFPQYRSMYGLTPSRLSFFTIVYTALYSIIYLVLSVAFIHLFVKAVYHRQTAIPTLLAAIAAVSATQLFSWIPMLGIFVGLYALVLTTIAIHEVERVSTGEAIIIVVALIGFMMIAAQFLTFPWPYR